jgi:hypothetical protein
MAVTNAEIQAMNAAEAAVYDKAYTDLEGGIIW